MAPQGFRFGPRGGCHPSFAQGRILLAQPQTTTTTPATGAPMTITLQDALQRARLNDPQYCSAITDLSL
jgi:hypothetical protein